MLQNGKPKHYFHSDQKHHEKIEKYNTAAFTRYWKITTVHDKIGVEVLGNCLIYKIGHKKNTW